MSKYNKTKSIEIDRLGEDELKQAIHEWAEGSEVLEELLWACRDNGIKTTGSHIYIGKERKEFYIALIVNDAHEQVKRMLYSAQEVKGTNVTIMPDGGNIFGTDEELWDKADLSIGSAFKSKNIDVEDLCRKLSEAIKSDDVKNNMPKHNIYGHMLDLYDFLNDKGSGLTLGMRHTDKDEYLFYMDVSVVHKEYFERLFSELGLKRHEEYERIWQIIEKDPEIFDKKVSEIKNKFMKTYKLEQPTKAIRGMSDWIIARIKKKEFGDTPEGKEKFKKWYNQAKASFRLMVEGKISSEEFDDWMIGESKEENTIDIE